MLIGRHVMYDLETVGLTPDSAIVQVGMCDFFPEEGRIGFTWSWCVDLKSSLAAGLTLDPDTLIGFWMRADLEEARRRVFPTTDKTGALREVLFEVADASRLTNGRRGLGARSEEPVGSWSHGAGFDLQLLKTSAKAVGVGTWWSYGRERDTRTLFALASLNFGAWCDQQCEQGWPTWPKDVPPHVAHDARSDAVAQALAVMVALERIKSPPAK